MVRSLSFLETESECMRALIEMVLPLPVMSVGNQDCNGTAFVEGIGAQFEDEPAGP